MVLSSGGSRGLGGLTPPPVFFFAFQYMKIPGWEWGCGRAGWGWLAR